MAYSDLHGDPRLDANARMKVLRAIVKRSRIGMSMSISSEWRFPEGFSPRDLAIVARAVNPLNVSSRPWLLMVRGQFSEARGCLRKEARSHYQADIDTAIEGYRPRVSSLASFRVLQILITSAPVGCRRYSDRLVPKFRKLYEGVPFDSRLVCFCRSTWMRQDPAGAVAKSCGLNFISVKARRFSISI